MRMQGRVREIAVDLVIADGARLPVLANGVLQRDAQGAPSAIRVALFDATERRAYERELLSARERARESEARAVALARTLQSSLLPPTIVQPPGLEIGAAYRPAGDGSVVGGDFYDIFETADRSVAVVVGDVAGKGSEAAVLTSLARHTLRTAALYRTDAAHVLTTVSDAFVRYQPDGYCTLLLVVFSPDRRRATIATGGHHLPVRCRPDRAPDAVGRSGQILGLLSRPDIGVAAIDVAPGDALVLFTDGVLEARRGDEFYGEDRTRATIERSAGAGAQRIADAVVADALEFQAGEARDDIAVVVARVTDES